MQVKVQGCSARKKIKIHHYITDKEQHGFVKKNERGTTVASWLVFMNSQFLVLLYLVDNVFILEKFEDNVNGRRTDNAMAKWKTTNNDQQTFHWATRTPLKTGDELSCSGTVISSCSTSGTHRLTTLYLIKQLTILWIWMGTNQIGWTLALNNNPLINRILSPNIKLCKDTYVSELTLNWLLVCISKCFTNTRVGAVVVMIVW